MTHEREARLVRFLAHPSVCCLLVDLLESRFLCRYSMWGEAERLAVSQSRDFDLSRSSALPTRSTSASGSIQVWRPLPRSSSSARSSSRQRRERRRNPPYVQTARSLHPGRCAGRSRSSTLNLEPILDDRLRGTELCRSGEARWLVIRLGSHDALQPVSRRPSGAEQAITRPCGVNVTAPAGRTSTFLRG